MATGEYYEAQIFELRPILYADEDSEDEISINEQPPVPISRKSTVNYEALFREAIRAIEEHDAEKFNDIVCLPVEPQPSSSIAFQSVAPFEKSMKKHGPQKSIDIDLMNYQDEFKVGLIHFAIMNDSPEIVKNLIRNGIDPSDSQKWGMSPLHFAAAIDCSEEMWHILLNPGGIRRIRVDRTDEDNRTALHVAALNKRPTAVKALLRKGWNPNIVCRPYGNALFTALKSADDEDFPSSACTNIIEELMRSKSQLEDTSSADGKPRTILNVAFDKASIPMMNYLTSLDILKGKLPNLAEIKNELGLNFVHTLVIENEVDFLKALPENIIKACFDKRLLFEAAQFSSSTVIKILLEKNADYLGSMDSSGQTVFHLCAKYDKLEALKTLLDILPPEKAKLVNHRDKRDHSALYFAAKFGHLECFKLLETKRSTEEKSYTEKTDQPIANVACKYGQEKIIKHMIASEWNMKIRNKNNLTPLLTAVVEGQPEIVRILLKHDSSLIRAADEFNNSPLHLAVMKDQPDVVEVLMQETPLFDMVWGNAKNETAFYIAIAEGKLDCVTIMLKNCNEKEMHINGIRKFQNVQARRGSVLEPPLLSEDESRKFEYKAISHLNFNPPSEERVQPSDPSELPPLAVAVLKKQHVVANFLLEKKAKANIKLPGDETEDDSVVLMAIRNKDYDMLELLLDNERWDCHVKTVNDALLLFRKCLEIFPEGAEIIMNKYSVADEGKCELFSPTAEDTDNHPLHLLQQKRAKCLLHHSLIQNYIERRWDKGLGRFIYHLGIILYFLFISSFSIYISNTPKFYEDGEDIFDCKIPKFIPFTDEYNHTSWKMSTHFGLFYPTLSWRYITLCITLIFLMIQTWKEVAQMAFRRGKYFKNWENYIEWATFISAGITILIYDILVIKRWHEWALRCSIIALGIGWTALVIMLRKYPKVGIYVVMFYKTMKTYTKFLVVFLPLFIAFCTMFHNLLRNRCDFFKWFPSAARTLVLMTGEFDFVSTFYPDDENYGNQMYTYWWSLIVFVLFCLVINILLSNILTGLAVDDIKEYLLQAKAEITAMQLNLVIELDYLLDPPNPSKRFRKICGIDCSLKAWAEKFSVIFKAPPFKWIDQFLCKRPDIMNKESTGERDSGEENVITQNELNELLEKQKAELEESFNQRIDSLSHELQEIKDFQKTLLAEQEMRILSSIKLMLKPDETPAASLRRSV